MDDDDDQQPHQQQHENHSDDEEQPGNLTRKPTAVGGAMNSSPNADGAAEAAAASSSSVSPSMAASQSQIIPPGHQGSMRRAPNTANTANTSNSGQQQQQQNDPFRGVPTRCLSGRDNIRITRDDLDDAWQWLTKKCDGGRITDRALKEQFHSMFGSSPRWTRKEFLLLASDPDLNADKLWNLLPRTAACASFDTVAETFALFDADGDGFVDDEVMRHMWVELFKEKPSGLKGNKLPKESNKVLDPKVRSLMMQLADDDEDDEISLEDWRTYAKKHKGVLG